MPDIYYPVSTTLLSAAPLVDITIDNQNTLNVVTLDSSGFVGKTQLSVLKSFLKPTSLSVFTDIVSTNVLLGRYDVGNGPIQEITLGNGLEIDVNGTLNCNLTFSGVAGGDFSGSFPNPTLNDNVVTLQKFVGLTSGKLLGRSSAGTGAIEEISLSADFEIVGGELNLLNTSSISATGFIISTKTDDFEAFATNLYFIDSTQINVTATVEATGNLGDQIIFINKNASILTIEFPNETVILTEKTGHFVRDDLGDFYKL